MISVGIEPTIAAHDMIRTSPGRSSKMNPHARRLTVLTDIIGPIAGRSRSNHRRGSDLRTEQTLRTGLQSRRATPWPSDGKPMET